MASASVLPSTPFLGPKSSVCSPHPPPMAVRFRPSPRVSASYATAQRKTASLYEVLGIQAGATCQEIKTAYRRLARVLHPDAASAGGSIDASADEFIRIHAAYSTLSDPEKRADYDRALFRRRRQPLAWPFAASSSSPAVTAPSASRFTRPRRNWETDQCW